MAGNEGRRGTDDATGETDLSFLCGGEMGERIRAFDWTRTSLGMPETWPQSLRTTVAIVLGAADPLAICWGRDLVFLYNDAWRPLIGDEHPAALGRPARQVFAKIWEAIAPVLDGVMAGQPGAATRDQSLPLDRHGAIEEGWFNYSFTPIPRADGSVGGILVVATESTEQVRQQQALREAERRYRDLVQYAPAGIYEIDFRRQRFTSVNDAMIQMTGYSRQDLLEMDPFDLLDEEGAARFRSRLTGWLSGEDLEPNVEYRIRTRDGTTIDTVLNVTLTTDEQGRPLGATVVAHDVTERRQRERRIGRYNAVLRGINRIFAQVMRAETEEALANTCLAVALEATGSQVGFIGEVGVDGLLHDVAVSDMRYVQGLVDDQGDSVLHGLSGRVVDDGRSLIANDLPAHPDSLGSSEVCPPLSSFLGVPLEQEGRTLGVLAVANRPGGYRSEQQEDLEALAPAMVQALLRKRTADALQESEARLLAILRQLPVGVGVLDRDGHFILSNAIMRSYVSEDIMPARDPQQWHRWSATDDQGRALPPEVWPGARALRGEIVSPGIEFQYTAHDGKERWTLVSAVPFRSAEGEILGAISTAQDITERKRAESELQSERQLLQTIYDTIPVMLTVYDPHVEDISLNRHVERVTGWTPEDAAGTHIMELAYPNPAYRQELMEYMQSLEPGFRDVRMTTKDGRTVETSWANVVLPDGRRVGIGIDISERKQVEEALRRYADRLRSLQEVDTAILSARSMDEVACAVVQRLPRLLSCRRASVALYDLDGHEMSLLAVHAREETAAGAGRRLPIDVAWRPVLEKMARGRRHVVEDLQSLPASSPLLTQVQAEGVRAQVHEPLLIGGGRLGTLNVGLSDPGPPSEEQIEIVRELAVRLAIGLEQARLHEEVQRYAGELEQLVQQRTAALEVSETRFRTIFEEAAIGIALADALGRLMATNPALQRMLGYSETELAGVHLFDMLDHVSGADEEPFVAWRTQQQDQYTAELRYTRKGGGTGEAIVTLSLLRQDTDESPLLLALVEDVTERKRAQEALLQTERLAIMGRMAASLAHEVNNPIQSVVGCLDLAMEVIQEGGDAHRYMEVAREEVARAARIVQQMRDLGRRREERKEPVDVGALIEKVLILTEKQAQEYGVEITWQAEEGLPLVPMVRGRVQQVFLNLVLNAIDAMPQGGQLRIRALPTEAPSGVQISFADTGTGITPDDVEHLFEAFYSTKDLCLGLGLYVSHNIVQEHGGRIGVESTDEGSTFTVWLPQE
ncbi:MAG: PAS domain S-box protein [Anaerolineae bacterium]